MPKGQYQKTIKVSAKPPKPVGILASYSTGQKQSAVKKPKSLTPSPKKK